MNIDWMTFKIEWKSKSAKIKRLLLDLLENDSHYNHVGYLCTHSKYWFKGRIHAEYKYSGDKVQVLFQPQFGYIIDFGGKKKIHPGLSMCSSSRCNAFISKDSVEVY